MFIPLYIKAGFSLGSVFQESMGPSKEFSKGPGAYIKGPLSRDLFHAYLIQGSKLSSCTV